MLTMALVVLVVTLAFIEPDKRKKAKKVKNINQPLNKEISNG